MFDEGEERGGALQETGSQGRVQEHLEGVSILERTRALRFCGNPGGGFEEGFMMFNDLHTRRYTGDIDTVLDWITTFCI